MTTDRIRAAWRKVPFRPFILRTATGESIPVDDPEALSFNPSGRTLAVWLGETDWVTIDAASVTEVAPTTKRSS